MDDLVAGQPAFRQVDRQAGQRAVQSAYGTGAQWSVINGPPGKGLADQLSATAWIILRLQSNPSAQITRRLLYPY